MTIDQQKLELAKSWFILAQLFMILAGFMFATGGIFYSGMNNRERWAIEQINQNAFEFEQNYKEKLNLIMTDMEKYKLYETYFNKTEDILNIKMDLMDSEFKKYKKEEDTSYIFFTGGFIFLVSSVICWLKGKNKITKL